MSPSHRTLGALVSAVLWTGPALADEIGTTGIVLQTGSSAPYPFIEGVQHDSPAEAAGLLPLDQILSIGGRSALGMSAAETAAALDGPPGTKVVLRLHRHDKEDTERHVTLTRTVLPAPTRADVHAPPGGFVVDHPERFDGESPLGAYHVARESFGRDTIRWVLWLDRCDLELRIDEERADRWQDYVVTGPIVFEGEGADRRVDPGFDGPRLQATWAFQPNPERLRFIGAEQGKQLLRPTTLGEERAGRRHHDKPVHERIMHIADMVMAALEVDAWGVCEPVASGDGSSAAP